MFTGIIEETGSVERVEPTGSGIRLALRSKVCARDLKIGDSLAVNGCCLTIVKISRTRTIRIIEFDLLEETWRRTNLQFAQAGALVNLERSMCADGRFGGHFVTGHIDGMGRITRWEEIGHDRLLEIRVDRTLLRHVVLKGSIAVDGISLTISDVDRRRFQVWIIPHTYQQTALRERRVGDLVNLESDILAKYVERLSQSATRTA